VQERAVGAVELFGQNVERFQGGLVIKAHRLLYHSTLGSRVIEKTQPVQQLEGSQPVQKLSLTLTLSEKEREVREQKDEREIESKRVYKLCNSRRVHNLYTSAPWACRAPPPELHLLNPEPQTPSSSLRCRASVAQTGQTRPDYGGYITCARACNGRCRAS